VPVALALNLYGRGVSGFSRRWRSAFAIGVVLAIITAACTDDGGDDRAGGAEPGGSKDQAGLVDPEWLAGRQDGYLAYATEELIPSSPLNLVAHAERAERDDSFAFDGDAVPADAFDEIFAEIDDFEDTTDFDVLYLLNLWYGYRDQLRPALREGIEQRLLGFKYWYTEPTPEGVVDNKYYWSENHRIIFHVDEYLAGQAFPGRRFGNDGRTGAAHRDEARTRISDWLDEKVRFGFTEWHSDVYYTEDVTPLLSLVEWAEDEELADRAAMVLDLVLFDIALHLHRGNFGATHGRSYMKDKSTAVDQDTFDLSKLLFDDTDLPYTSVDDAGAVLMARAERYRMPEVIRAVASSDEEMIDRERMGVPLDPLAPIEDDPKAPYGYDFDDPDNVPFWWEKGALTSWQLINSTFATLERHDLWSSKFFSAFEPFGDALADQPDVARTVARDLAPILAFPLLPEVNTYTYRSADVMLSTAQDHRPGLFSDQNHAWQATLDEEALVFTTHPKNEPEKGTEWPDSDGYWTGSGSMPRSAQHGTVGLHLYAPQFESPTGGPLEDYSYIDYTHAYFPTEHFDEVATAGHWVVGRRGDAYVGLWSWRAPEWRRHDPDEVFTHGLTEPFDLVAPGGPDNVWIVEVGDSSRWDSLAEFSDALAASEISVEPLPPVDEHPGGFDVAYTSPSQGELTFGWKAPLTVDGDDVPIDGYPRYDNPFATVAFDARRYTVRAGGHRLELDFEAGTRATS
jgi:hypothetical protein